jgi:hypothetical protein
MPEHTVSLLTVREEMQRAGENINRRIQDFLLGPLILTRLP